MVSNIRLHIVIELRDLQVASYMHKTFIVKESLTLIQLRYIQEFIKLLTFVNANNTL